MTAAPGGEFYAGNRDSAATRDVWQVLAGARTDDAPRTLAAVQDAVFQRYLPIARTLARRRHSGGPPVDCADADRAAERGLAQAVLGWRRADSDGFELFAGIAIAAQLDRLPVANTGAGLAGPAAAGRAADRTRTVTRPGLSTDVSLLAPLARRFAAPVEVIDSREGIR